MCGVCSVRNACFINSGFFLLGIVCGLHVLYPWGAFCMCDRDFFVVCTWLTAVGENCVPSCFCGVCGVCCFISCAVGLVCFALCCPWSVDAACFPCVACCPCCVYLVRVMCVVYVPYCLLSTPFSVFLTVWCVMCDAGICESCCVG